MAEFEFGGMTFKGGKMFVVLTALSTLGGTAWGAFEFYNDYRNMKETIESYVAPDMSGIEQTLAVQQEEMSSLRTLVDALDVKVEIMSAGGATVFTDVTRSGSTLTVKFTGTISDSAYYALLTYVG